MWKGALLFSKSIGQKKSKQEKEKHIANYTQQIKKLLNQ